MAPTLPRISRQRRWPYQSRSTVVRFPQIEIGLGSVDKL
jgi:hypothetical protein